MTVTCETVMSPASTNSKSSALSIFVRRPTQRNKARGEGKTPLTIKKTKIPNGTESSNNDSHLRDGHEPGVDEQHKPAFKYIRSPTHAEEQSPRGRRNTTHYDKNEIF